jgi:putative transposase
MELSPAGISNFSPMDGASGDQFEITRSAAFTGVLIKNGIAISMHGKGAWRDNIFVERLWRSIKYEEVYLRG